MNNVTKAVRRFLGLKVHDAAPGHFVGRARTRDVSYAYRMPAGFLGDVNRSHPASIEPNISNVDDSLYFGGLAVVDTASNTVRLITTGDDAARQWGIAVRPYPFQQQTGGMAAGFSTGPANALKPGARNAVDILRSGYIMAYVNEAGGAAAKGGQVYVWLSADAAPNYKGSFLTTDPGADAIAVTGAFFNGPADENGVVEIEFNV